MWIDPVLAASKGAAREGERAFAAAMTSVDHFDHGVHTRQGHFYTIVGSFLYSDMGSRLV
jgi:hypothetical protein